MHKSDDPASAGILPHVRRRSWTVLALLSSVALSGSAASPAHSADQVTFVNMLSDLGNLDNLAQFPAAVVKTGQASATCTTSFSSDWYCNTDWTQYVRTETNSGRTEQVMADVSGPGAITRLWTVGPPHNGARIRFYFDGSPTPAIDENLDNLMLGNSFIKAPFVYQAGPPLTSWPGPAPAGLSLMAPMPFANRVVVTYDGPSDPRLYYNLEYRQFAPGTAVRTFAVSDYTGNADSLAATAARLSQITTPTSTADAYRGGPARTYISQTIAPGQSVSAALPGGSSAAIRLLTMQLSDVSPQALRGLRLAMAFDGEQTVSVPVGDFFGSGLGFNPGTTQTQSVGSSNSLSSRWTMPYQGSGSITLTNTSSASIGVTLGVGVGGYAWNAASMHFHAYYKDTGIFSARDVQDMRFLNVFGTGVLVGDNETINQIPGQPAMYSWWGEGDEKIYADDKGFPSHLGTGSEDYYGYAYGHTTKFQAPWNSQVLAPAGLANYYGETVLNRTRLLDTIPFNNHLRFDFEFWAWNHNSSENFQHVAFFYARPGAIVTPDAIVSGATYTIQSKVSGWNIDVTNGSSSPNAPIQDYVPNGSDAQSFVVTAAGGGYYTFKNVLSGLYLDVPLAGSADSLQLQQYPYNGSCAQLWKITGTADDFFAITGACNGKNVDLNLAALAPTTHVNQYRFTGTAAQEWKFNQVSP